MKFIKNFSFKKLLESKRYSLIFSLCIAFIVWLSITIEQKPIIDRTISNVPVNVNLENTFVAENQMSIIGDISQQKFTVIVRGPSYAVSEISASTLGLYASASSVVEPGNYNLEVAASSSTANAEYEIVSISPQTLNVDFDYVDTKEFTIIANAEGAVASEGLIAEKGVVSGAESDTVTIKGPRTILNQVNTVTAYAKVNKTLSQSESFDAELVLYDEKGEKVDATNLSLSFSKVKVTVPISKKKTVPVKVEYTNLPAGFDVSVLKSTIDYANVTVIGAPDTVDKTSQISLSPIDITQLSPSTTSFDVSAKLPEGVRLLDNIDHFTVKIDTKDFVEKIINVSKIKYVDVGNNLTASGTKNVKNVRVYGPRSVISKLDEAEAYATVSLLDKKAGEHTVNAIISFENSKTIFAVGTYSVSVSIK